MSDWKKWAAKEWQQELKCRYSVVESIGHPVLGYMPIQDVPII
jgi:hypothetical protein